MKAFKRMDLLGKFEQAGFLRKYGGEFFSACGDEGVKFYFKDAYRSQTDHSYQVTRAEFDKVLLDHAAESGAEVHEGTGVTSVEFADEYVDLTMTNEENIRARYVIDASGRNSILGTKFNIK